MKIKNEQKKHNNPAFIKYRTRTLAKAIEDTADINLIAKLKQQIYNINYLSFLNTSYALQNDLALLDKIIDFVERSTPLLDQRYTEDVWHIKAELYHLKSMIANQDIYNSKEIKEEINEIITYANEHLV